TIHDLNYCYGKFMTVLLTQSSKEANRNIFDMNKFNPSKYEFENITENENSNLECETNFMDDDNKLEGRIFMDSPFFKRYVSQMCDVHKSVVNSGTNDNRYYAPDIADYITNHYMPFAPMWSALLLKVVAPTVNRLNNANIEGYFNIMKKYVLNNEGNLEVGRFITKMKNYTSQLCSEIKLHIPMKRNKRDITQCNGQRRISKKYKFQTSTPISHEKSNANNISKLNLSESSTHANALNNGLLLDVEYCMNSPDPMFTI
ncbi:hypothetical protein PV327_011640, partial [Microctonus hyperodae]